MRTKRVCLVFAGALVSASALATITDIAPFSGDFLENYEGLPSQGVQLFLPNPITIMGGQVTLSTSEFPGLAVYDNGVHQFGNVLPSDGVQYLVTQNWGLTMRFDFGMAMKDFGGFWSSIDSGGNAADLNVNFLDTTNQSVGSVVVPTAGWTQDGVLPWLGWNSDVAFTAVEIQSSGLVQFDSTRANAVPEPASLAVLALGAVALLRRKRG